MPSRKVECEFLHDTMSNAEYLYNFFYLRNLIVTLLFLQCNTHHEFNLIIDFVPRLEGLLGLVHYVASYTELSHAEL